MFFIENQKIENKDTIIPNIFFEKILPILSQEENALAVYMYGYYMAKNEDNSLVAVKNNEELANKLKISVDSVYNAWDFCEEIKLIKKHKIDNNKVGSYKIEFKDLRAFIQNKSDVNALSENEVFANFQNKEYQKMYEKVQNILGYPLSPSDIKKIYNTIAELNISKELIVEAVLYAVSKKNKYKVNYAMMLVRNWYLDGIRTVQDLEQQLQGKEKRYLEYKRILNAMGEYRMPTEPEEKFMDRWLDELNFNLDSIIEAVYQGTGAKTPTFRYINGILENWHKDISKNINSGALDNGTDFEIRMKILENLKLGNKTLTKQDKIYLDEISSNYGVEDIDIGCRHLSKSGQKLTLSNLYKLFKGEKTTANNQRKVTKKDIEKINNEYKKNKETQKKDETDKDKEFRVAQYKEDNLKKENDERIKAIYVAHPFLTEIDKKITAKNIEISKSLLFTDDKGANVDILRKQLEELKRDKQNYISENNIEL